MRLPTMDPRGRTRTTTVATLASFALLSTSGLALAQSTTTVTTTVAGGSRQLAVTDLAGNPLTAMALSPGVPTAFRVRVADSDYLPTQGFAVQSTLTNLYRQGDGGYDYATSIPSARVSVSYPTSPLSLAATAVDLRPDYLVASAAPIDCNAVANLTPEPRRVRLHAVSAVPLAGGGAHLGGSGSADWLGLPDQMVDLAPRARRTVTFTLDPSRLPPGGGSPLHAAFVLETRQGDTLVTRAASVVRVGPPGPLPAGRGCCWLARCW